MLRHASFGTGASAAALHTGPWRPRVVKDSGTALAVAAPQPPSPKPDAFTIGRFRLLRLPASCAEFDYDGCRPDAAASVAVIVQRRGLSTIGQGSTQFALRGGEWTVCDASRPFTVSSVDAGERAILMIPKDRLGLSRNVSTFCGLTFGGAGGTGGLLAAFLTDMARDIDRIPDGDRLELADTSALLVRLVVADVRQSQWQRSAQELLRERIKDYVRRNLRNQCLSIDELSDVFRCSKRHLHKAFAGEEMTLNQYIWFERLERCSEALRDPANAHRSVTEISFMWGFNNSAHFSKAFKLRFNVPPTAYRGKALERRHENPTDS